MSLFSFPAQFHTTPLTDHFQNYALDWLKFSPETNNVQ